MSTTTDERTPDSEPEEEARPEDERLPFLSSLGYGVQHILSMFGGVIAVPIIVGGAAGLSGAEIGAARVFALFVSGLPPSSRPWACRSSGPAAAGAGHLLRVGLDDARHHRHRRRPTGLRTSSARSSSRLDRPRISPFFARVVRFFPPVVTGTSSR